MNFAVRGATRALVHLFTPHSREPEPPPATDEAGVRRFRAAIAGRAPDERARAGSVLIAGGLSPETAAEIVERGLTAEDATDLLCVELLHPDPNRYGPAMAVLSLIAEARAAGALSGRSVRARLARLEHTVVIRPDGYLVPMLGGQAIEKRADLELGQVFHLDGGVLRRLGSDGVEETPVAELALDKYAAGAFLDGVESVLSSVVLGLVHQVKGLIEQPEETLDGMAHGFGRIPETVARVISTSPELLAAYERASPDDQNRFVGSTVAQAYLSIGALLLGPEAKAPAGPPSLGVVQVQGGALALNGVQIEAVAGAIALAQLGVRVPLAASGVALAVPLDLHPSSDPRIGPTTIPDARTRQRVRDRIQRTLGDPRDPNVTFAELLDHLELASELGQDAVRELRAMILERIEREVRALDGLPPEARAARVRELREFVDSAGIEIRDALRRVARPPARSSLSPEAQQTLRALDRGQRDLRVSSRAIAEEILQQYPDYVETGGWVFREIKTLIDGKASTFHWDEVFGADGYLINHEKGHVHSLTPHLQLHPPKSGTIRIFFPRSHR